MLKHLSLSRRLSKSAGTDACVFEQLEKREVFDVTVNSAINDVVANSANHSAPLVISLLGRYTDSAVTQVARFVTNHGNIDIALYDNLAPNTVANFLSYFSANFYNGTIFHRSQRPNIQYNFGLIQGGGFRVPTTDYTSPPGTLVPTNQPVVIPGTELHAPINLEHPTGNESYTVGVARVTDPNSGTSQFYINVTDNSGVFDASQGFNGYATFGTVLPLTRATVDTINNFTYYRADNAGFDPALTNLPLDLANAGAGTAQSPLVIQPADYMTITGSELITDLTGIETAQWSVSVTSNPTLVSVVLNNNGTLTITPNAAGTRGTATIRLRATSADNSTFVDDEFTYEITNFAPSIGGMQGQANVAVGGSMLMSAFGVHDNDGGGLGGVDGVQFWYDADGDGEFNADNDTLLGGDDDAAGGWSARVSTAGMQTGANTVFAVATDSDGATAVTTRVVTLRAAVPSSGVTPGSTTVNPGENVDLGFNDSLPDRTGIRSIRLFLDSNNDGVLDPLTDRAIGFARYDADTTLWSFTVDAADLSNGANRVFARITDNYGNFGGVTSSVITVGEGAP